MIVGVVLGTRWGYFEMGVVVCGGFGAYAPRNCWCVNLQYSVVTMSYTTGLRFSCTELSILSTVHTMFSR